MNSFAGQSIHREPQSGKPRLLARVSELDGTQYWLVMFRATRRF